MPSKAIIQFRRDTSANWTSTNPVLSSGEVGYETDTKRFKIGDGTTVWGSLTYNSSGLTVSATAPASPNEGSQWYNSTTGQLLVYYDNFWVESSAALAGPTGPVGPTGIVVQDEEPANTDILWLDSDDPANQTTLPLGGATGQVLAKATGDDYDTEWVSPFGPSSAQTIDVKGSNYSLTSADAGKLITNSGAVTITVEGLAAGQQVDFLQTNASQITFVAGSGVTLNSKGGNLKTAAQYSPAAIKCTATNTYVLVGDLGA